MSVFWALYAFFFAVPFPMILYYSINYAGGDRHAGSLSSPYWALAYFFVSVVLWGWLLSRLFFQWVIKPLKEERVSKRLLREGIARNAEILASKKTGKVMEGHPEMEITFRFDNLSHTPIHETVTVVDMRPELHRFNTGQSLHLRVSNDLKTTPIFAIEGSEVEWRGWRWLATILGWLLLTGLVIGYYMLSYQYENQGTGWRFLTFFHPLFICPFTILGIVWLFSGGLGSLFLGNRDALELKYRGYRADARLLDAKQTGTYINEQPQVRFELEYKDRRGGTHQATIKKVVNLLDMGVTKATTIPIFYLENQPKKIAFYEELNDL